MASRDYINKKKKKNPTKKSKPQKKTPEKLMIVLAIMIIALFAAILYVLILNKPDSKKPIEKPKEVKRENTLPPKPEDHWRYIKELEKGTVFPDSDLPKRGKATINASRPLNAEQRKILESFQPLPNTNTRSATSERRQASSVITIKPPEKPKEKLKETPATKNKVTTVSERWNLQCGSFKTSSGAESVKAQLAFAGFNSRIVSSNNWYRVILGPYASRDQANDTLKKLKSHNIKSCIALSGG